MSVRQHPPDVAYQLINDSIQREPVPMRAFHCKTRLISFRLSDDEYECLHLSLIHISEPTRPY